MPREDEEFLYEGMVISPKTVVDGKPTEVLVHILDEDELAEYTSEKSGEEVTV